MGGEKIEEVFSTVSDFESLRYNEAKEILDRTLNMSSNIKQSIMEFCTLRPREGETLKEYVPRLQQAARECDEKNENMILVQLALHYREIDNNVFRKAMEKDTTIIRLLEWYTPPPSGPRPPKPTFSKPIEPQDFKPRGLKRSPPPDSSDSDDDRIMSEDNAEVKLLANCGRDWIKRWCGRKDFSKQKCIYLGCSSPADLVGCFRLKDYRNKEFVAPICLLHSRDRTNFEKFKTTKSNIDYLEKR